TASGSRHRRRGFPRPRPRCRCRRRGSASTPTRSSPIGGLRRPRSPLCTLPVRSARPVNLAVWRALIERYTDRLWGIMKRDDAIGRLKEHETELRRLGVEHLYLFGSTVRGEAREDSDVDLFFDHPEGTIGLYQLMDVRDAATRILGNQAD